MLELVEGPTLAERLAGGPLPLDEARGIALQIAAALESAHERGIVHRDLKPANVKIRPDGTVKVLDFGLAKAWEPPAAEPVDVSAPTFASPAMTRPGIILGTAAYMSPEQARGAPVDKRTDVWAFGCVLFEMLAGRHVFGGAGTVSDAIAAVLKGEPDWQSLPANTPPHIRSLLKRCLEKDPRQRLRDIGDAGLLLGDTSGTGEAAGPEPRVTPPPAPLEADPVGSRRRVERGGGAGHPERRLAPWRVSRRATAAGGDAAPRAAARVAAAGGKCGSTLLRFQRRHAHRLRRSRQLRIVPLSAGHRERRRQTAVRNGRRVRAGALARWARRRIPVGFDHQVTAA